MRFRYLVISLIVCVSCLAQSASLCVDHYPPHQVVLGENQAEGYAIEFAKEVVDALNDSLQIVTESNLEECLKLAHSGKVDLIMGLYKTPERSRFLDFYKFSDGYSSTLFITFYDHLNITSFQDLANKRIGVVRQHHYFDEFDQSTSITKIASDHLGQAIFRLKRREVDFVAVSRYQWEEVKDILRSYVSQVYVADFQYKNDAPVFLAASKTATLPFDRQQLAAVVERLYRQKRYGLQE